MKACILSFTRRGARLSLKLKALLQLQGTTSDSFTMQDYLTEGSEGDLLLIEPDLPTVVGKAFADCSIVVFIGACGIAVRAIAPFVQDKKTDPAVLCLDEKGKYVIPLLSGHIGGANKIAATIAAATGCQPVITTATDINGLLAVDEWAVSHNLYIGDMKTAKLISASLVDGKAIGLFSDFEFQGEIPEQLSLISSQAGICISIDESLQPFETTLNLIPRIIYLGLGCKKDTSAEAIEDFVLELLAEKRISMKALAGIASIDLKEQEEGLLQFASKYALPLTFYSAEELENIEGDFTRSGFVKHITGTDNVCERAATLASHHGDLIISKSIKNGVTAALALRSWRVNFED